MNVLACQCRKIIYLREATLLFSFLSPSVLSAEVCRSEKQKATAYVVPFENMAERYAEGPIHLRTQCSLLEGITGII